MKIATPSLDRLTAEVKDQFLARVNGAEFRVSSSTGHEHTLSTSVADWLRVVEAFYVASLIRELHGVDGIRAPQHTGAKESALRATMRGAGIISEDVARELLTFVNDVKWAIRGLTSKQMKAYADAEVGTVLVDFFHINYEEFDPEDPDNAIDYNADDGLPEDSETPHNHLADLVQDAVAARLIKRDGRELMLAWVSAQSSNE